VFENVNKINSNIWIDKVLKVDRVLKVGSFWLNTHKPSIGHLDAPYPSKCHMSLSYFRS